MATDTTTHRLDAALRQPPGLWPFLPAGFPDLQTTAELLHGLSKMPIRGVEVGFPFSDPIADGPVIQHAFTHALARGVRVADVFETVRALRAQIDYPLIAMVSASIVYRMGLAAFCGRAAEAGFDGLIVPDLPLEEVPALVQATKPAGLRVCMLVAPTTPAERQMRISQFTDGFLYYVSVQGVTGKRQTLSAGLSNHVSELRRTTHRPVLVGFGISSQAHVREVCGFANGTIVGSAIVHQLIDRMNEGLFGRPLVECVLTYIQELAGSP